MDLLVEKYSVKQQLQTVAPTNFAIWYMYYFTNISVNSKDADLTGLPITDISLHMDTLSGKISLNRLNETLSIVRQYIFMISKGICVISAYIRTRRGSTYYCTATTGFYN